MEVAPGVKSRGLYYSQDEWVIQLRDISTGQVLTTFEDLSTEDGFSFYMVRDKLMAF